MRTGAVAAFALAAALVVAVTATGQPPGGKGKGKGGFPGGPGFAPPRPGEIVPAFLQDVLKLTDDQKKRVAELQKRVDARLDKILTADQKRQLKEMSEMGPGGFPGGPPGKGP